MPWWQTWTSSRLSGTSTPRPAKAPRCSLAMPRSSCSIRRYSWTLLWTASQQPPSTAASCSILSTAGRKRCVKGLIKIRQQEEHVVSLPLCSLFTIREAHFSTCWEASPAPCNSQTLSAPYYHSKKDGVNRTAPTESLGHITARTLQEGDPEGWWQETFKSHTDSKPMGPEAISMDLTFHGSPHLYGLPEHATSLSLQPTVGEPVACNLTKLLTPVRPAPVCAQHLRAQPVWPARASKSLSAVRPCSPQLVGQSLCLLGTDV